MSGGHNYSGSSSSEASKLLEAALEQMDGIIQGARFELPSYGPASGKQTNPLNIVTIIWVLKHWLGIVHKWLSMHELLGVVNENVIVE